MFCLGVGSRVIGDGQPRGRYGHEHLHHVREGEDGAGWAVDGDESCWGRAGGGRGEDGVHGNKCADSQGSGQAGTCQGGRTTLNP